MNQIMKKSVSLLLSLLMALSVFGGLTLTAAAEETYAVGDHIQFGTYPQTQVTDEDLIAELDAAEKSWASYEYYSGTGNNTNGQMKPGNWMRFADFFYNGEKYRAVVFDEYRPNHTGGVLPSTESEINGNKMHANGYTELQKVYYFRYEPLYWRILDPTTGFILSESIIDSQPFQSLIYKSGSYYYQDAAYTTYANCYNTSYIREWLSFDFYETAFSETQKNRIRTTELSLEAGDATYNCPNVLDKVFLLSYAEADNASYGFSSKAARSTKSITDYTKCQGISMQPSGIQ